MTYACPGSLIAHPPKRQAPLSMQGTGACFGVLCGNNTNVSWETVGTVPFAYSIRQTLAQECQTPKANGTAA